MCFLCCRYLGVVPSTDKFEQTHFTRDALKTAVSDIQQNPDAAKKNRIGEPAEHTYQCLGFSGGAGGGVGGGGGSLPH